MADDLLHDVNSNLEFDITEDTSTDTLTGIHEFEKNEARDYVAGYICNKLRLKPKKYKQSSSWVSFKGEGRVKDKLTRLCRQCDKIFDKFHGNSIRIVHDPLGKLQARIIQNTSRFPSQNCEFIL